jgi:drug/metabolite transporter (DMT)-like permease
MVTGAIILETALFMIPITLLFAQSYLIDSAGWITMFYTGTICTGGALLLYNLGLQKVKASISSIILLVEVVFGMIFAFFLLGEMPGMATALGGALVLIAIAVISFGNSSGNREEKKEGVS